jgi:hypothetical protein
MSDKHSPIVEIITAIAAAIPGFPAAEIRDAIESIREKWDQTQIEKIRGEEQAARFKGMHRRLISGYYASEHNSSDFRQYTMFLSKKRYPSTVFTTSERVGLSLPLHSVETEYTSTSLEPSYPEGFIHLSERRAEKVLKKLDLLGVRIWDQDLFRLVADPFEESRLKLSFSLSRYFRYRFTAGLLEDEVFDALASKEGDIAAILQSRNSTLPMRQALLPTISCLSNLDDRISAGGLACVVAMARGAPYNDYCIPLQIRSDAVAEGRGAYTASLQAWHQPMTADLQNEAKLYWSVLREMFEEVYGGDEVEAESRRLRYDWYLDECPGVAYVHKNPDAVTLEFLGIGMNALLGTYDCAVLLAIHDPKYWDTYSSALKRNWEAKKIRALSTRRISSVLERIFTGGWLDQSMFGLSQGLLRLHEIAPKYVELPDLDFELQ